MLGYSCRVPRIRKSPRPDQVEVARHHYDLLSRAYPDAACELDFGSPFELLLATVLSAQSTDRRVNGVTPELFARFPTPADLAVADPAEVERIIRPTGFYRAKTEAIVALARDLVDRFDGVVPNTLEELVTLRGVGRKTANVVLGDAFAIPGITTDTHFLRVSRRLGWTGATKPDDVEAEVGALFPEEDWIHVSHLLIWLGRRCCHARRPACGACPVGTACPAYGEGPTDPEIARALVREPRG